MKKGPHRILFDGASDECYRRLGFARRVMFVLENMMEQRRLDQHVIRVLTGDGALVTCSKAFGIKTTVISVAPSGAIEELYTEQEVLRIVVHVDMITNESWSIAYSGGTTTIDPLAREDIVSAVAVGHVDAKTGKLLTSTVVEPYSATYEHNLLAENGGAAGWEGVWTWAGDAPSTNTMLSWYNDLFQGTQFYTANLPTISYGWLLNLTTTGHFSGLNAVSVPSLLTTGYITTHTEDMGTGYAWSKDVYDNPAGATWATPPSFVELVSYRTYDPLYSVVSTIYTTYASSVPAAKYHELTSDGITYEDGYFRGIYGLIRHDYRASFPLDETRVNGPHRYYKIRTNPVTGYQWKFAETQQVSYTNIPTTVYGGGLASTSTEYYEVRGMHRTKPTDDTKASIPYKTLSNMGNSYNYMPYEQGDVLCQNFVTPGGLHWYFSAAGGNIGHVNYERIYNHNTSATVSTDMSITARGLYHVNAVVGRTVQKWDNDPASILNASIRNLAAQAIEYLGGTVYDNASIPLDIPEDDRDVMVTYLDYSIEDDFKTFPGLLYCSPLYNLRVYCMPISKKVRVKV